MALASVGKETFVGKVIQSYSRKSCITQGMSNVRQEVQVVSVKFTFGVQYKLGIFLSSRIFSRVMRSEL